MAVVISLIRDAIRTSKLSRRWKKLYAYRSNLEFNWRDIISDAADTCTPGTVSIFNAWYFQRSIDAFLASYLCSKVESFKLHCCFGNKHPHCFNGRIEFTVTRGAEILDLAFSSDKISERTWTRIDHYDFPTQLLPRGEGSNLRHLKLRTCKLMSDKIFVDRFSAITTLVLRDAKFDGEVEPPFSSCSKLESLKLDWCSGFESLSFDSLESLKTLVVRGCEGLRWIRLIGVTNLTTFRCVGDNVNTTLQRVPNLKDVCYIMKQINVISALAGWQKIMNPNFRTLSIGESG